MNARSRQRGSIIVYILIAIFLTGLLVALMSQGAGKTASSEQINEMMMYLQADIQTVQANINECVVSYQNNNFCPSVANGGCAGSAQYGSFTQSGTADYNNPNIPFPAPYAIASAAGTALTSITCPRAPSTQNTIFTGGVIQSLKLLQDTNNYTATYYNNASDGVYIRITRAVSDPAWTELLSRISSKYATCSTVVETIASDPAGFNCSNGCLYFFILRDPAGGTPVFPVCH